MYIANYNNSARPIVLTLEILCGLNARTVSPSTGLVGLPGYTRGLLKCAIRIATCVVIVIIAILVPSFDTIMAFCGSALVFGICIIFPLSFHLKLFGSEISPMERLLNWFLIVVCSAMALIGTVFVLLPKNLTGANNFASKPY